MKTAFLFAGQGTQKVGMARDVYEADPASRDWLDDVLDPQVKKAMFEGPQEELDRTEYAQPAIVAHSLALARRLQEAGIEPDYAAGLSLGEYSALCTSGVFDPGQCLEIVSYRGQLMQQALEDTDTGMLAVMGADEYTIQQLVSELQQEGERIEIANYNSPVQIVLSGRRASLQRAQSLLKAEKIRVRPLNVTGAFHSSYLNNASERLFAYLLEQNVQPAKLPVVFNVTGKTGHEDIRMLLKGQICHSVQFRQSLEYLAGQGVERFVEIGPGKTLSRFVRQTLPEAQVFAVSTLEEAEKLLKEWDYDA